MTLNVQRTSAPYPGKRIAANIRAAAISGSATVRCWVMVFTMCFCQVVDGSVSTSRKVRT